MSSEIAVPHNTKNPYLHVICRSLNTSILLLPFFFFFHLFYRFSFKIIRMVFFCFRLYVIFSAQIDFHVSIDAKHIENLIKNWLYMVQLNATTTSNHSFYHNLFFFSFALHRPAIQFFSLLNIEYFTFKELHSKLKA